MYMHIEGWYPIVTRLLATTVVALALLLLPQAAGATEPAPPPNAFMRIQVVVSESGLVDIHVVKAYSGDNQTRDMIHLPNLSYGLEAQAHPQIETTGAVTATYDPGGIDVRISRQGKVFIHYQTRIIPGQDRWGERFLSADWLLQQRMWELGRVMLVVEATLPVNAKAPAKQNGLRLGHAAQTTRASDRNTTAWTTTATLDPGADASLSLWFTVPRNTAPGWLSVASFTLAGAAFVLALVAVYRQNRLVR